MSVEIIFRSLEKLVELHQELHQLSLQKTTFLKKDAMEDLQHILVKERKVAQAVERTEQIRRKAVDEWMDNQQIDGDGTVSEMLENITDEADREMLARLSTELTEEITSLKRNEQLNHDLLQQSLQFVQLSLDLLDPSLKNMNYGKQAATYSNNRSVFDTKA